MRTQEEIKLICEEIQINVQKAILEEERTKTIRKAVGLIKTHQQEVMTGIGIIQMGIEVHALRDKYLRAQSDQLKMKKAFEDYRKRVEERL